MLLEINTRYDLRDVHQMDLASEVESVMEGTAMGAIVENGVSVVRPVTGSGNERFVGICISRLEYPDSRIEVESHSVAGGTVTLRHLPMSSTDLSIFTSAGIKLTAGVATEATQYSINGRTITVNAALNATSVAVRYRRALSVREAEQFWGRGVEFAARGAETVTRSVSVARRGQFFIDNIASSANWEAGGPVWAAANGIFTMTDTGVSVPSARVIAIPSNDTPFLGLEFSAY